MSSWTHSSEVGRSWLLPRHMDAVRLVSNSILSTSNWRSIVCSPSRVMILSRLPDGTTLFEERLDQFRTDWRAAPETRRLVLDDGRPPVRLEHGSLVTALSPYL